MPTVDVDGIADLARRVVVHVHGACEEYHPRSSFFFLQGFVVCCLCVLSWRVDCHGHASVPLGMCTK